ncbi:hypothetical protein CTT31_02215 [Pseudoalteromonas maricaloris]|uniref:hypothetical protein n=1 Tax=Pseudoalteromonas maricaloris TaxID=184924 RepID=UPI0021ADE958|nr:hypothetical protein [Pseudoalteromonas flavipulchra]USE67997.1 hypothetical protein CTT31_02215 [Pseudoalteromonas flavipulchra]
MDAERKSGLMDFEFSDIQKIRAVKKLVFSLSFTQEELDQLVAELAILAVTPAQFSERVLTKPESNVVDIASRQHSYLVTDTVSDVPQKTRTEVLKEFLQSFSGKPKVLDGYRGMSVTISRKEKTIQLRDSNKSQYFRLISYPISHQFTNDDADLLIAAHSRFMQRREAGMPWRELGYLLNGSYRQIVTFKDLFEYYKESASSKRIVAINRIQQRYFNEQWGVKKIALYSAGNFKVDYLDRTVPTRQPSDRNEVIKIINAAISKAKADMKVKIDVQQLVRKGERSRADNTDKVPPKLSTLAAFLKESYDMGEKQLVLSLITQLMVSTRKTRTNFLQWHRVNIDECYVEVPSHESKTKFVRYPFPARFRDIVLSLQSTQLSAGKDSQPNWLFESKTHANRPARTLDKEFNQVRANLLNKAKATGASEKELNAIRAFTQYRIRDIVQKLVLKVGATLSQKEKCLGRQPDDVGYAYDELSIEALCELKDKMIEHIEAEHPELKALFQCLIDKRIC